MSSVKQTNGKCMCGSKKGNTKMNAVCSLQRKRGEERRGGESRKEEIEITSLSWEGVARLVRGGGEPLPKPREMDVYALHYNAQLSGKAQIKHNTHHVIHSTKGTSTNPNP